MDALVVFVLSSLIAFYLVYLLLLKRYKYWEKKNVPYVKPLPLLGNYSKYILLKQYVGELLQDLCKKFPNEPYFGAFFGTEPVLVVQSPDILQIILTKDFYYFSGREISEYTKNEVLTKNLFFANGNEWKTVRHNVSPLFSSAKLKNMFYLIEKCSHELEDLLDTETKVSDLIEVRDFMARYTMDCICSCAFGVHAGTMSNAVNNPFRMVATEIFKFSNYNGIMMVFRAMWPRIFYGLRLKLFSHDIVKFFSHMLKNVFESRNYQPSARNDFVDLVLELKKKEYLTSECISNAKTGKNKIVQFKMDDDMLLAQCVVFFGAGFETSATISSFTLYELAKNPEVQQKALEEVDEYLRRHGNKINFECVNELTYLESCAYETMRLYPVLGNLTREVMEDFTFPSGLRLEKGVRIHIPVYHIHRNPDNFPDPEEYKPERFMPENRKSIKPNTFFPYGGGQRVCVGKRFSKMQMLSGLVTILKKYKLELAPGMPETVPIESRSFLMQPRDHGLHLKFIPREKWEERCFVRE